MPNPLIWDDPNLEWDTLGLTWDGFAPNPKPNSMAIDNKISVNITAEQKAAIVAAVTALKPGSLGRNADALVGSMKISNPSPSAKAEATFCGIAEAQETLFSNLHR